MKSKKKLYKNNNNAEMDDHFLSQIVNCYEATFLCWDSTNIDFSIRYNNNGIDNISKQ